MRVLLTGATGLIGKEIGKMLAEKGHHLFVVTRSPSKAREQLPFPCELIEGDLNQHALHDSRLQTIEGVINLMGEPIIGGRWTEQKKKDIYNSRVQGTKNLVSSLPENLKVFVSGSAMGFYGDRPDEILNEESSAGTDYLANVCVDWEKAAHQSPGRVVCVRTSIVLAQNGGALDQMLFPFRAGVGGSLGDGKQWMSWIHLEDIAGLFVFALENENVQGALNGSAPQPVTNKEFSKKLAASLGKSLGPAVPLIGLKALFGEASVTLVASTRMSEDKALRLGYQFKYADLSHALEDICAPYKQGEDFVYSEQFLPHPPEKVFPYFQNAHNLERLTPPTLSFNIQKVSTEEIQQGTLIDYKLKIHGLPVSWKTEIDEWTPPYKFVDNQLKGPYSLWHHTHEFRPFCGGTLMVDRVRYKLPFGYVGWICAQHFVKKDVQSIFAYRRKFISALEESQLQS